MRELGAMLATGGVLMLPILSLSVVALAVFLERAWALRLSTVLPRDFLEQVLDDLAAGRIAEVATACENHPSVISAVTAAGLEYHGHAREQIKENLDLVRRAEVMYLDRYVKLLGAIAVLAPLLGLLATAIGAIDALRGPESALSEALARALVGTAAGLAVAAPSWAGFAFLRARIGRLDLELEDAALDVLDALSGTAPRRLERRARTAEAGVREGA